MIDIGHRNENDGDNEIDDSHRISTKGCMDGGWWMGIPVR